MQSKKGFTLVEFIVAVTIFMIVMTVAIGSIVSLSKLKIFVVNMKNTQQKGRIALEMISRYAKEAKVVTVTDEIGTTGMYRTVVFTFDSSDINVPSKRFSIDGETLNVCDYDKYLGCVANDYEVVGPTQSTLLVAGDKNYFKKIGNTTSTLDISLYFKSKFGQNTTFDDTLLLYTTVLLEEAK